MLSSESRTWNQTHGPGSARVSRRRAALWASVLGACALLGAFAATAHAETDPKAGDPKAVAPKQITPKQKVKPGSLAAFQVTPWLMEEFDWGDSKEIVRESIDYTPNFLCFKFGPECKIVQVNVDGEDLIARYQYHEEELWRVAIVTPPLDAAQMQKHGRRVAKKLASHISRTRGKTTRSVDYPAIADLEGGTQAIHHWKADDMVIDVVYVRNGEKYFVGAYFADPVRGVVAQTTAHDPTQPKRPKPVKKE